MDLPEKNSKESKLVNDKKYTVPAPFKGAASIQKIFFGPMQYDAFDQNLPMHI